jgi:hypothetical protein
LNLNVHFHMLMLDGAYLIDTEPAVFRRIAPPSLAELQALVELLAERIGRALERQGVLARDAESSYLELGAGGPMEDLLEHSYRVAVGSRAGQKVLSLQSVPARAAEPKKAVSCGRCSTIVQSAAASRPIAKGLAGPGLLAHVLTSKYCDHLPLNRQSQIYAREGVELSRSNKF